MGRSCGGLGERGGGGVGRLVRNDFPLMVSAVLTTSALAE